MSLWLEDTETGEWELLWHPLKRCGALSLFYRMVMTDLALRQLPRPDAHIQNLYLDTSLDFGRQMMAAYVADDYRILNKATHDDGSPREEILGEVWGDAWSPASIASQFRGGVEPPRSPGERYLQPIAIACAEGWVREGQHDAWTLTVEFYANLQMTPGRWAPSQAAFADAMLSRLQSCRDPR
jgi:hypothetical protein